QPRINAFISVEQQPADEGVPLAHKDMFYRKGRVSNCGSKIRRGWIAQETSTALSRLDSAGMTQIGTLNMAEFAYGPTGRNEHWGDRSEEHTSELQSRFDLVCRLLLEKKKKKKS